MKIGRSTTVWNGAEKTQVCEPLSLQSDLVLTAEFEAWPEPKILKLAALRELMKRFGGSHKAAVVIGASEAFVRLNGNGYAKCEC